MTNKYDIMAIEDNLKDANKRRIDALNRITVWQSENNQERIDETLVQIKRLDKLIADLTAELAETV